MPHQPVEHRHAKKGPGNGGGRPSTGVTKHPFGFQEDGLRHEHRSGAKHRRCPRGLRGLRCVVVGQQRNDNVSIDRDQGAFSCLARSRAACRGSCGRDREVATAWRLHSTVLAQSFGYARLPTRACGLPALDDIDGQPNGDELARTGGPGPAALVHDRTGQCLLGDFRQILVLVSPNHMGIDLGKVRFQSTTRGGIFHDRWPFSC